MKLDISILPPDEEPKQEVIEKPVTSPKPVVSPDIWKNHTEYIMAEISSTIGLGNVWRFPFVAFQNGGGAFLVPYLFVLVLIVRPMYYAEAFIGHFAQRNSISMWSSMAPIMAGTGYASALACSFVVSYYSAITAICFYYLAMSFQRDLPWAYCHSDWSQNPPCVPSYQKHNVSYSNGTKKSSAELYFTKSVLNQVEGLEGGIGIPRWYLAICLFIVWLTIFMVVSQGVRSHGRAAYFLTIFPYAVMIILLVSTLNLKGSLDGLRFFFEPKWAKIFHIRVWYAAITQCFFSFGISVPSNIGAAASNHFGVDIYRDALMMIILDALSSLLSGIIIFGILGNLSHVLHRDMHKVVGKNDISLFFTTYPDAVMKTPVPQVFAVLFFLMMSTIGVSTSTIYFIPILNAMRDTFPKMKHNIAIPAAMCLIFFIICLVYVTPSGQFIISLVDYYGGTFLVLACCFAECIGIFWCYGLEYFCLDIEFMLNRQVTLYWRITWGIVIPVIMLVMFMYAIATYHQLKHGTYVYPLLAYVSGNLMVTIGALMIPIYFIYYAIVTSRKKGITFVEAIYQGTYSKDDWGPANPNEKKEWQEFVDAAGLHRESRTYLNHVWFIFTGRYDVGNENKKKDLII